MAIVHVLRSSIFLYAILIRLPTTRTISDSEALLKLKQSFTNAKVLDSWKAGSEPCTKGKTWTGVVCSHRGSPSGLRLGSLGLSGKIDVDALVSLSGLRSISFVSNEFSGPIPSFNRLGALKGLFLSKNQFSGEIPSDYFNKMKGLKKLWLSENNFSGQIPSSLGNLSRLMELHLDGNQFSGTIPALVELRLISLNVSNNKLEGEIPSGLSRFGPSSFGGNSGLCGASFGKSCIATNSDAGEKPNCRSKMFIWLLLAAAVVFIALVVGIIVMKRRQDKHDLIVDRTSVSGSQRKGNVASAAVVRTGSSQRGKGSKRAGKGVGDIVMINEEGGGFGMVDLMKAAAEVLGNGALGCSYKATMASGDIVVVKRIKEMSKMGRDQFDSEMRRLGSLKHKNVITPLAYHYRREEKLLVYEHQPKGSLLFVLHGDAGIDDHPELTWPVRMKVIQGVARGLGFLHTELSTLELPHGNLKSSNVLLTSEYEALLTDYGLSPLISSSRAPQALAAYKSPEAIVHHHISPKCDVYCLGVIIFETVTGRAPQDEGGTDMVQWVRSTVAEGKQATVFDPSITGNSKSSSMDEMEKALRIGVACTESNPEQRLDITEAIKRIESLTTAEEGSSQEIESDECVYEVEIS